MENLESAQRLSRDLAASAATLSTDEARFLVDAYYSMQNNRLRSANQERALSKAEEPHAVLTWLKENDTLLENQIKRALEKYAEGNALGQWALSIVGIGPVITAGLLAHIDIERAPTVGHIWRFAGLDPTSRWEKGQKRPWNATLKTLCWKIGESFIKVQNIDGDFYGQIFSRQKKIYVERNQRGEYAERAARILTEKKIGKATDAYAWYSGEWARVVKYNPEAKGDEELRPMLPPAHVHAMARRYAVKLFLAHYHGRAFELAFGRPAPLPYPIVHLGHAHIIESP